MSTPNLQPNPDKLQEFMGKAIGDMGAAMNISLILIGDRLGLYKAMAGAGPMSPAQLAECTGTKERYVREWLCAQAAGGYVTYDAAAKTFTLPDEQAFGQGCRWGPGPDKRGDRGRSRTVGRIERGGGDGGEPVRSAPGRPASPAA